MQRTGRLVVDLGVGLAQRLAAEDGVVARAAVQPVVAQTAEDDVVGVVRPGHAWSSTVLRSVLVNSSSMPLKPGHG
jgi:hypothetical protein